jgi:hypothetical protein
MHTHFAFYESVESSGINRAVKRMLEPWPTLTIWVHPDFTAIQSPEFVQQRPYAEDLNKVILNNWANNRLPSDVDYVADQDALSGDVPKEFQWVFDDPKFEPPPSPKEEIKTPWQRYAIGVTYVCPKCRAEFSKPPYLARHFARHPDHAE